MSTSSTNPPLETVLRSAAAASHWIGTPVSPPLPSNLVYPDVIPANRAPRQQKPTSGPTASFPSVLARAFAALRRAARVSWYALAAHARRAPKSLVVSETASLGDRRLLAVVEFERQRFLIGSCPSSVTLLASLPDAGFGEPRVQANPEPEPSPDGAAQC